MTFILGRVYSTTKASTAGKDASEDGHMKGNEPDSENDTCFYLCVWSDSGMRLLMKEGAGYQERGGKMEQGRRTVDS